MRLDYQTLLKSPPQPYCLDPSLLVDGERGGISFHFGLSLERTSDIAALCTAVAQL